MRLREKDLVILVDLVKIGKRIQRIYQDLERGYSRERASLVLLRLIDRETEVLYSLNVEKEKLKCIEEWYKKRFQNRKEASVGDGIEQKRVNINFDTRVLLGLSDDLNDYNYPYYRIVARLRYLVNRNSSDSEIVVDAYATDTEVELLYFELMSESRNILNFDNSSQSDITLRASISKKLESYGYKILIDSIEAEVTVARNNMNPLPVVYDCMDFHSDLITSSYIRYLRDNEKQYYCENIEDMNLNNRARSTNNFRIPRFNCRYAEVMNRIILQLMTNGDDAKMQAAFLKDVAYVKTLISTLKRGTREKIYRNILEFDKVKNSHLVWLNSWVLEQIKDIENNLVPYTQMAAMLPYYGSK